MKRLRGVKAIIFDLDNTLVSSHIDYARLKQTVLKKLAEAGVPDRLIDVDDSVVENFIRGRTYLKENSTIAHQTEFNLSLNEALSEIEMERVDQVQVIEGAHCLINSLKEDGFEVGILTRGSRDYATAVLSRTGFDGQVVNIVCRDDYPMEEAKPNPLAMVRIAEKLRCLSKECLFIGDHPMDFECANASGAAFVGVLTGSTNVERWSHVGCKAVIDSIADLLPWRKSTDATQ